MLVNIEDVPAQICFERDGYIYCNWVPKGKMALVPNHTRFLKFEAPKEPKTSSQEEAKVNA